MEQDLNMEFKHGHEKWDVINSPQYVDFANLPNIGESFFNKLNVIASTPIPNDKNEKLPNTVTENSGEETLIATLENISLSDIEYESEPSQTYINEQENDESKYIIHKAKPIKFQEPKVTIKFGSQDKKSQNSAIYPFTFDLRSKDKNENKEARIKKILEDEKKVPVFRANPVPKFIKAGCKDATVKTTLWKKPPFIPLLPHKKTEGAKTPPLRSTARALERKRFDQHLQEKERLNQQIKEMEIAAKKRQEQKEILELRKRITFKAKPIPKYKPDLPQVKKRPLTEPISPISLKRRRRVQ
ncbi:unnamed protein product [Xylocopa violacea]|uniref:TPX2 C-terminal domain-containing protein n=1 Tax=Xylocopa violacea TaxID=135666 RepID=A0ABP1N9Z3_XYLVO